MQVDIPYMDPIGYVELSFVTYININLPPSLYYGQYARVYVLLYHCLLYIVFFLLFPYYKHIYIYIMQKIHATISKTVYIFTDT